MDTQQLLDSLTAHMALYHRCRPLPSLDRNPNPRKAILRWFSNLSVDQRRSFITVVDPDFVKILIQMQMRMRAQGHGFFFILTDIPSSTDQSLPTLCFRRSRGLLARYYESNSQERSIRDGLLLFGSKEGVKSEECSLDSVTVSKELVSDVDKFVDVMDSVSDRAFLRGEVDGLGSKWCELEWLKEKGYYTLEAFVANKLELALRLAWLSLRGGKNKKGGKLREKAASSGIVANVFWRKKSCSDWFLGLDPGIRKEMAVTFLSKGAKYLEKEIFKSPGLLKDGVHYIKVGSSFRQNCSCDGSYGKPIQLHFATDIDLPMFAVNGVSSIRDSRLYTRLVELFVLQKITSMLNTYANNESGAECLLYSTLDSVQTIFDHALRRFQGFLTVVARDSIEHELVKNLNTNHPSVKKLDDKHALDTRRKTRRQNSKKANSRLEALKADSTLKDSLMDRNLKSGSKIGKHTEKGVKEHKISTAASTMEHTTSENRVSVSRKKSKRNGVVCKRPSLKESTKVEIIAVKAETLISPLLDQNDAAENTPLFDDATLNDIGTQDNPPWQSSRGALQNESCSYSGKEACKGNMVDNKDCHNCEQFENEDPGKDFQIMHSFCTKTKSSVHDAAAKSSLNNHLGDVDSSLVQKVGPVSCGDNSSVKKLFDDISLRLESGCPLQPISTENMYKEASPNEVLNDCRSLSDYGAHCPRSPTIPVGGKSYEWPSLNPVQFSHLNSNHSPAATDRYHLDVTNNWPGHFHQSYYSGRHQIRTSCTERVCSHMVPCLTPPPSLDWPPMVRSGRLSQSGTLSYDAVYNTRLQSSLCTGISTQNMQLGGSSSDSERKFSGDGVCLPDHKKTFDFVEDNDSNWMSEEEYDIHTTNGRDYSKFFGGGIMYWNPSDPVGTSFSRAPSHSSEDSSWAWYEADLNMAIDDMIDMSGFPPYSGNGLASPTGGTFSSPLDGLGFGSQSLGHGYAISATEVKKPLDPPCSVAEVLEEKISGNKNTSPGPLEGVKGDSLPYPILRPIVIPSTSRKGSRSEFKYSHDHVSPCLSSSRHDQPGIKRPPSPVVLCVPRSPRVPPPSPVGESRKHRGFPVVRSGSSSPRNWGLRNLHHEETKSSSSQFYKDGPEVVWAPWENKGISSNSLMQPITGSLLQDRLIAITQLARDQDHPDVIFPLQPPEMANCSSQRSSLSVMHCLLQEEINSFCKQVASENQLKKPYINWAVKRVAKSLQVLWPRSRTSIFGSNVTGLALPTSDVDLVVCLPPVRNLEPIKEAGILEGRNGIKETCLQHAARYLANQEWVKNDSLKTIENTTIPLIMLVAVVPSDIISSGTTSAIETLEPMPTLIPVEPGKIPQCGPSLENAPSSCSSNNGAIDAKAVSLDISFKSAAHTGLQTTNLVRELTDQFPASVPLALVLKQFLADRSLDRAYSGGLSSYCLVLLITRFLQHEHHAGRSPNQNLGSLLMDFLYFFGNVFDPRRMRVSILGSGFYMNREGGHSIDPIHIDDPLCPTNNVGRNCFRIHQCIKAFADAYSILEREMPLFSGESDPCAHASIKLLPKIIPSITIHGQDSTETKY